MEDFYIVLPSNVSSKDDEINKTSCYKTYLPTPIDLEQNAWEVALVQINYPHSWCNINEEIGNIHIIKEAFDQRVINKDISIPCAYYSDIFELLNKISSMFKSEGMKSTVSATSANQVIFKVYPAEDIYIHKVLAAMLGFPRKKAFYNQTKEAYEPQEDNDLRREGARKNRTNTITFLADQKFDLRTAQYNIYVYCDIVKLTLVGNVYVPLLHSIGIDDNPGNYIHKEFLNPHYLPLQNGYFSNIQIRLCDDVGDNIKFEWGKVILKLHFRRRRSSV